MASKVLNNKAAAAASASQQQLTKDGKKDRSRLSNASKPTELSDKSAKAMEQQLTKQLFHSAKSITPAPGVDTSRWAARNYMLMSLDGTTEHKRLARPGRLHNTVDSVDTAPVEMRILTGHGGTPARKAMVRALLESGSFDAEAEAYVDSKRAGNEPARTVTPTFINSAEQLEAIHTERKAKRAVAEKPKGIAEAGAGGGTISETVSGDALLAAIAAAGTAV